MGYCANGDGSVTLKDGVDIAELKKVLDKVTENTCIEFDFYDSKSVCFWESDTHWHEEDTFEFLKALMPYITEGCANYYGEESCIWRYVFDEETQTWTEENATIDYNFESYTDEELIAELTKRGYKVTR